MPHTTLQIAPLSQFHFRQAAGNYPRNLEEGSYRDELEEELYVSYPNLLDGLERDVLEGSVRRFERRRSTVPTPLGLFAGVGEGTFADLSKVPPYVPTVDVRVGAPAVWAVYEHVLQDDGALRDLTFQWNSSARLEGGRYELLTMDGDNRVTRGSVGRSEIALTTATIAAEPVVGKQLVTALLEAFPRLTYRKAMSNVRALAQVGLLQSSWISEALSERDVRSFVDMLSVGLTGPASSDLVRNLSSELSKFSEVRSRPLSGQLDGVRAALQPFKVSARDALQIDSSLPSIMQLPFSVKDELCEGITAALLTNDLTGSVAPALKTYHERFMERFGTDVGIPLATVISEYKGIGFPSGYAAPRASVIVEPERTADTKVWSVGALLGEFNPVRNGVVELNLSHLGHIWKQSGRPPVKASTLESCVRLLSRSREELERGDFRLVHEGMSRHLGMYGGRFGRLLSSVSRESSSLLEKETCDFVPVEIITYSLSRVADNVQASSSFLSKKIFVSRFAPEGALTIEDVLVFSTGSSLAFQDAQSGERLKFFLPSMLNLHGFVSNLVRLLVEVSHPDAPVPWDWGELSQATILPRVEIKSNVLARKRWQLRSIAMQDTRDKARDFVRERLDQVGAPDYAVLNDPSKSGMEIELRSHEGVMLIDQTLRRFGRVTLEETDESIQSRPYGWAYGHSTEIVVGAMVHPIDGTAEPAFVPPVRNRSVPAPDPDWISLHLYTAFDRLSWVVANYFTSAHSTVFEGEMFWIRYADPSPHLRLRAASDSATLNALVAFARKLFDAGVISKWSLVPFEPEIERYGGPRCANAMYQFFVADSVLAASMQRDRTDRIEQLIASIAQLLLQVDPVPEDWVVRHYRRVPVSGSMRSAVKDIIRQVDERSSDRAGWLLNALRLLENTDRQRRSGVARSILHMHFNRMFGIDKDLELRTVWAARELIKQSRFTSSWTWSLDGQPRDHR